MSRVCASILVFKQLLKSCSRLVPTRVCVFRVRGGGSVQGKFCFLNHSHVGHNIYSPYQYLDLSIKKQPREPLNFGTKFFGSFLQLSFNITNFGVTNSIIKRKNGYDYLLSNKQKGHWTNTYGLTNRHEINYITNTEIFPPNKHEMR